MPLNESLLDDTWEGFGLILLAQGEDGIIPTSSWHTGVQELWDTAEEIIEESRLLLWLNGNLWLSCDVLEDLSYLETDLSEITRAVIRGVSEHLVKSRVQLIELLEGLVMELFGLSSLFESLLGAPLKDLLRHDSSVWATSNVYQTQVELCRWVKRCQGIVKATEELVEEGSELFDLLFAYNGEAVFPVIHFGEEGNNLILEHGRVWESLIDLWAIDASSYVKAWANLVLDEGIEHLTVSMELLVKLSSIVVNVFVLEP